MRVVAALLVMVAGANAANGVYTVKTDLGVINGKQTYGYGVCSCVGAEPERFILMTCAHVVANGAPSVIIAEPEFATVETVKATVLAADDSRDLALISVSRAVGSRSLPVWPIGSGVRGPAEQFTRELQCYRVDYDPQPADRSNRNGIPDSRSSIAPENGDSGAPVVQDGRIVAVVYGTDIGTTQYRCGPQGCYWEPGILLRSPIQPVLTPFAAPPPVQQPQRYVRRKWR